MNVKKDRRKDGIGPKRIEHRYNPRPTTDRRKGLIKSRENVVGNEREIEREK